MLKIGIFLLILSFMENEKPKLTNKYFLNMYDIEHFRNKIAFQ